MCASSPHVIASEALERLVIVKNPDIPPDTIVTVQQGKPVAAVKVAPPSRPKVVEDARPDPFTVVRVVVLLSLLVMCVGVYGMLRL